MDSNDLDNNDLLNSSIKIIDFGLFTKLGSDQLVTTLVGTPYNIDPIILNNMNKLEEMYNFKVIMKKLIYGLWE